MVDTAEVGEGPLLRGLAAEAVPPATAAQQDQATVAEVAQALEEVEAMRAKAASRSAQQRWEVLRQAVWDGRVHELLWNPNYCFVSATFAKLFPHDFDRGEAVVCFMLWGLKKKHCLGKGGEWRGNFHGSVAFAREATAA